MPRLFPRLQLTVLFMQFCPTIDMFYGFFVHGFGVGFSFDIILGLFSVSGFRPRRCGNASG
jgi:hypothetical protein